MTNKQFEHHAKLLASRIKLLPIVENNAANGAKDKDGSATAMLALTYRFIGINEFLLNSDIDSFQKNLTKAAQLRLNLFRRYESGEGIDPSYVSMLSYKSVFDALAANEWRIATDLAQMMGGRSDIENEYDHYFDFAFGYALKAVIASTDDHSVLESFNEIVQEKEFSGFQGYGIALKGIVLRDDELVNSGLMSIVDGHRNEARNGVFKGTDDEFLCVWGVGLSNLAKHKGLRLSIDDELIPKKLL